MHFPGGVQARQAACAAWRPAPPAPHASLPRRWALPPRLQARRAQAARTARRASWAAAAWGGAAPGGGGGGAADWSVGSERLRVLTKFVTEVDPGIMQSFEGEAHPEVLIAMRQTITNMLGTLPPQFFRIVISTEAENLAQLMYSVLLSGYMFANAWTRLSLTQSMAELPVGLLPAPPPASSIGSGSSSNGAGGGVSGSSSTGGGYAGALDGAISIGSGAAAAAAAAYAPGSQKLAVEGQVLRWHLENGKEAVPALQYIEQLEAELAELRQQMEASAAATASAAAAASSLQPLPGNELLEYLQRLSPDDLVSLTDAASEDVLEAMNLFVQRLMGMEEEAWQGGQSDCTASELATLMYWLMVTGYSLRQLEQRCDLTRTLDLPPPGPEPPSLPPGRLR